MNDIRKRIFPFVAKDLGDIETALKNNLGAHLDIVTEVAGHILFSGGKRLRPLLMVLASRLCGYAGGKEILFSTVFEYLHVATLLHDDLVDEAQLRRGRETAHSVYGNAVAVLVGDFLLSRSLAIGTQTGSLKVMQIISNITEEMSQGEIHQLINKGNTGLTEAEYMAVIRRKTAVLIQGACRVGALIADAPLDQDQALADYGIHTGMAFQMADDLLDYTADPHVLGKNAGADLREGKLTMPVIHLLKQAAPKDRKAVLDMIAAGEFSSGQFLWLIKLLEQSRAIAYTREKAAGHVEAAKGALAVFPASETRDILEAIADYAILRSY